MTNDALNRRYFEWMCQTVCDNHRYAKSASYRRLLTKLHNTPFEYTMPMDGNRAADGIDLRYRFGRETNVSDVVIATYLDDRPCSILEMMIALSIRCEEHIMEDSDIGDRTGQWFWNMIVSLGLGNMTDNRYDVHLVNDVIRRFLDREYGRDGHGSLFVVKGCRKDMRDIDIWYQMCMYLETIL